jgi:RNA recognition motif-containing protein
LGTKLRVDGLPPSFSTQHVLDLFTPFGTVLSARVITDPRGQSLRMGEVELSTPREAQKALRTLHRSYVQSTLLLVFEHGDKDSSTGPEKKGAP